MDGASEERSSIDEDKNKNLEHESGHKPRKYERKEIYCPILWNECCKSLKAPSLLKKINEKLVLEDSIPWQNFCYHSLLACVHILRKEEEEAAAALKACSEMLLDHKNENFFKEIFEGLEHILLSCEMFSFIEKEDNEQTRTIFSRIKSFHVLNQVCQAAILAAKALILDLFGSKAQQEALKSITTAIELDPDELGIRRGAWYALAGRIHAEIRNTQGYNMMPSLEERRVLERSIQKDPFPIHYAYLADTYRQMAKVLIQQSFKNNKEEAEELTAKAKKMYENAINSETTNMSLLNRCGMGLIKLPKQFRNVELAGIAFDRVLKIDPNNRGALMGMGNLMQWCMNDYEEALKYFEKASLNHPVGRNIIQIKSMIDENYCPLEDCDKYLETEKDMMLGREESMIYYHVVKAEYFLVKNKQLMEAAQCWEKAITSSASAKEIWEYQCLFGKDKRTKFSKIMLDQINLALKERMDKTDVEYFKKILKLSNSNPQSSSDTEKK